MKISHVLKLLLAMALATFVTACSDYDNPEKDAYSDYNRAKSESSLIDHNTLNNWINAGSANGRHLVIVDVMDPEETYIRGAVPMRYTEYLDGSRSDGLYEMSGMVPTGEQMDAFLSKAGITENSTIVITGVWGQGTSPQNNITRTWWVFKYWGFSNAQVKVLNGGNNVFRYYHPENMVDTYEFPKPSNFSVKDIRVDVMDLYRASFGEVYEDAMNGVYERGERIVFSTLAPSQIGSKHLPTTGATIASLPKGAGQITAGASTLLTKDAGSGLNVFVTDKTVLETLFIDKNTNKNMLPADKSLRITTYCGSGMSTSPWSFLLQEVLEYTNVAIYDGSMGEWGALSRFKADNITETSPATPAFKNYLYFTSGVSNPLNLSAESASMYWDGDTLKDIETNAIINNSSLVVYGQSRAMKWDTSKASELFIPKVTRANATATTFTNTPPTTINWYYDGDGREVTREDREYKDAPRGGSGSDSSSGGGASGGC